MSIAVTLGSEAHTPLSLAPQSHSHSPRHRRVLHCVLPPFKSINECPGVCLAITGAHSTSNSMVGACKCLRVYPPNQSHTWSTVSSISRSSRGSRSAYLVTKWVACGMQSGRYGLRYFRPRSQRPPERPLMWEAQRTSMLRATDRSENRSSLRRTACWAWNDPRAKARGRHQFANW